MPATITSRSCHRLDPPSVPASSVSPRRAASAFTALSADAISGLISYESVKLRAVLVPALSAPYAWEISVPNTGLGRMPASRTCASLWPRVARSALSSGLSITASTAEWVLTLNPDVLLEPGFVRSLLDAASVDPKAGAVCGKLLSIGPGFHHLADRGRGRPLLHRTAGPEPARMTRIVTDHLSLAWDKVPLLHDLNLSLGPSGATSSTL